MPLKSVFFKLCQLCIAKKTIKVHIETLILYKIYCKQLDFLCNMSYDGIGRLRAKFATHALLG